MTDGAVASSWAEATLRALKVADAKVAGSAVATFVIDLAGRDKQKVEVLERNDGEGRWLFEISETQSKELLEDIGAVFDAVASAPAVAAVAAVAVVAAAALFFGDGDGSDDGDDSDGGNCGVRRAHAGAPSSSAITGGGADPRLRGRHRRLRHRQRRHRRRRHRRRRHRRRRARAATAGRQVEPRAVLVEHAQ